MRRHNTDALNQLSTVARSRTLTVGGYTTTNVCAVAVNGLAARLYQYNTYAVQGISLVDGTNTLTAIAQDTLWRRATNTVIAYWPATATFQYDLNGSLVWDGKKRLDYDADNQLITVTFTNAVQSKFVYDGLARLRIRREYTWQTNAWRLTNEVRYIYDHNLVIQERDSNNVPKATYTRGLDLSASFEGAGGVGGLLAFTQNGTTNQHFYYDNDGAGNITGLFDTNSNQVAYYLYDPFGNSIFASGPMAYPNRNRSFSKEFFDLCGIIYFARRFYIPNLHRFANPDPLGELGGLNLYPIGGNNPISNVDPYGLAWYGWLNPFRYSVGYAQAKGEAGLKAMLSSHDYVNMADFMQANPGYNGNGNMGPVQAAANLAGEATQLYVNGLPQLAGAGITVKAEEAAAQGIADVAEQGLWQRFKKFCFGKKSPKPGEGINAGVKVGDYTLTGTVAGHIGERVSGVGEYSGSLSRAYLESPSTINEIIATGRGVPDPAGLVGALRYDVPGTFRGSEGTWEMVVDPNTKIIYHFNFTSGH